MFQVVFYWIVFPVYSLSCSIGMQLQLARSSEEEEDATNIVEMDFHLQDTKPADEQTVDKSKIETRRKLLMR